MTIPPLPLRVSVANPYEYPLEFQRLKDAACAVFQGEGVRACKVTLAFVDNPHIHRLNNQFLQHDEPTDVLTFPYTDPGAKTLEGEVVIGYEVAKEYAADRNHDVNLELVLYAIHGALHLCGYDDTDDKSAAKMRVKEREYLAKLGLPDIAG
ncbi:MAG: rRNA maturation RNase YbeY [Planctomycetaceae bacterium]|nr:rRNA maturation RNase YbeY [Planctomycetaceae bacterium]